jgi:RNA polymerase sigma-70 factor, ECF subfamily
MLALALQLAGGTDGAADTSHADALLLAAAARRDQSAFEQLVKRHYPVVYRVVWRIMNGHGDAEDVTQEAFLRLWNNPGQLREASALRGWLIRVASNLVMDRFRRKPAAALDAVPEVEDGRPSVPQTMDRTRITARIDAAIAQLPERQRLALTLVQYEHMSNIAAARVLDVSVDAFESLLARARRSLKQELSDEWRAMLATLAEEG